MRCRGLNQVICFCLVQCLEDVLLPSTGQDGTEQTKLEFSSPASHFSLISPRTAAAALRSQSVPQSLSRNCYLSTSFFQTLDKTKRNKWFSSPSHCSSFSSFNGYLSVSQVLVARDPASRVRVESLSDVNMVLNVHRNRTAY